MNEKGYHSCLELQRRKEKLLNDPSDLLGILTTKTKPNQQHMVSAPSSLGVILFLLGRLFFSC